MQRRYGWRSPGASAFVGEGTADPGTVHVRPAPRYVVLVDDPHPSVRYEGKKIERVNAADMERTADGWLCRLSYFLCGADDAPRVDTQTNEFAIQTDVVSAVLRFPADLPHGPITVLRCESCGLVRVLQRGGEVREDVLSKYHLLYREPGMLAKQRVRCVACHDIPHTFRRLHFPRDVTNVKLKAGHPAMVSFGFDLRDVPLNRLPRIVSPVSRDYPTVYTTRGA